MSTYDAQGRRQVLAASGALPAGAVVTWEGAFRADGTEEVKVDTGALDAGDAFDGGLLRDAYGRRILTTTAGGLEHAAGFLRDAQGRQAAVMQSGALVGDMRRGHLRSDTGLLVLADLAPVTWVTAPFFSDTAITGTAGSAISTTNLGGPWVKHSDYTTGACIFLPSNAGARANNTISTVYLSTAAAPHADGWHEMSVSYAGTFGSGVIGVGLRCPDNNTPSYVWTYWDKALAVLRSAYTVADGSGLPTLSTVVAEQALAWDGTPSPMRISVRGQDLISNFRGVEIGGPVPGGVLTAAGRAIFRMVSATSNDTTGMRIHSSLAEATAA